ncbi:acetyltransferase [Neobacillus bataviensis LMG 21833]|uniref:Acetyltransferase n=2 Tax=Neobacillus bataviensis TaxID=220685 RepID=K6CFA9_9BACI|nr:acetyltransferase [Neobacillus bataviensis LMG 21833]
MKGIKTGRQHEFLSDFHISSFEMFEEREICYWIDREHWGKGIATDALKQFLSLVTISPLYVRAAKDNIGSRLVLEKCGFAITGEDSGFANARDMEIEEFIFTLR